MSTRVRAIAFKSALAFAALVAVMLGATSIYAYGQSVGRDQVAEVYDAGPDARAVAFDPAAPDQAAPTATTVPSAEKPGELFEFTKDARKAGGLWLAVVVVLFAGAAFVRRRTAPKPGEESATGWRARSYAIATVVAAVAATLIDIGFGSVGWSALALPVAFGIGRVMDAFNPPKGDKAKGDTTATSAA